MKKMMTKTMQSNQAPLNRIRPQCMILLHYPASATYQLQRFFSTCKVSCSILCKILFKVMLENLRVYWKLCRPVEWDHLSLDHKLRSLVVTKIQSKMHLTTTSHLIRSLCPCFSLPCTCPTIYVMPLLQC